MKIANTEYNTIGAYKLLLKTLNEKPLEKIENNSSTASFVFFNKDKRITLMTVTENHEKRGYFATISVRTIRKSATEGYFVKDLGRMNLRSLADNKDSLNILDIDLDYLYRRNHYATRMMAVAVELAHKQGYKHLIAYAPHDPIISFKQINNKTSEHEDLGDRTEMFFDSCGFKNLGTYKDKYTRGEGLKVYVRTANRPLKASIERESQYISSNIIKRIKERGEDIKDVITENQVCKQQQSIC